MEPRPGEAGPICSYIGAQMPWYVDSDGVIYSATRQPIGVFDINGDVYDRLGIRIGSVDIGGDVYDQASQHLGFVSSNGTIYDAAISPVAKITLAGEVFDLAGVHLGTANRRLHEPVTLLAWRPMPFRAAAAVLFLLSR